MKSTFAFLMLIPLVPAGQAETGDESTAAVQAMYRVSGDGSVVIDHEVVPMSSLLSEGGQRVLMRSGATEGPGAPIPLPSGVQDIVELRHVYNENLRPYVEHMRKVFPVDIEETSISGIPVAIVTPKGGVPRANRNRLVLNGPGGGFRTGVRGNGLLISIPMAATLGVKVVSILYRQGPEHRFPAASEDLLKVWDHYTRTYRPGNIGMVGCSAGGSLISQTTAMLIKDGRPTPGVLGVYCAGLGAQFGGDSRLYGNLAITNVALSTRPDAEPIARPTLASTPPNLATRLEYFSGVDMEQFIVNPTVDESLLARFPPTIFFTASRDFAMSGAAMSHWKLLKVGVDSELLLFDGLYHGFMTNPDFPESQAGYEIAGRFFDRHLGR